MSAVAVVTVNGRHDLSMPETLRFGRAGKISADSFHKSFFEWEAVRFEVDNIVKEERFICPACSLDMLAVSVDGNRKHYRFKNSARSEEQAIFEGVFISKDPSKDVARFVDYIHSTTKHVSGRGVCGGEWSAARETSKRSTSKLDEEGLELAVCRHGVLLCALNMYRGEIFAYPLYLQEKLARRTDMLTLLAMRWNQQKINNLATSLSHRHQKATKALQSQMQALETMKAQLAVTESQLEDWVNDGKEWAEATSTKTTTDDADALASRIEVLVASIKRRSQRLYKDTDGNKARARIRCKIRKEMEILTSVVESYNSTESLCLENILSEENAWPWQLPHSDSVDLKTKRRAFDIVNAIRRLQEEKKIVLIEMDHHWRALQTRGDGLKELSCLLSSETMQNLPWVLSEEGLRGLQSTILRKRQNITERKLQARACYLQVWSGAENVNFLHRDSADDYDSDSDSDMD
ncbi:hypothetical protein JOQ06_019526 [Pogonophryne albipinna]|uniref:Uncharacterized protein n=1 Tax=Pogonophryne albipinna TaxID=1090488 RepID=A0AAD6AE55_9TELE|nr:hypothetical protein JOQ06_019526 [Pogonophryne albipinna]